jgi:hypothetical protein
MPAAAEIQVGTAKLNGIAGAVTMTGAATFNMSSRNLTDGFKMEEIPSQDGAVIESVIASQRTREYDCEFAPSGATRAAAEAVVDTLTALGPLAVITIAGSTVSAFNGTYNLMPGTAVRETRDGHATVVMKLKQYETAAAAGTFAALAVVTG